MLERWYYIPLLNLLTCANREFSEAWLAERLKVLAVQVAAKTAAETFEGRLIMGVSFAGDSTKLAQAKLLIEQAVYQAAQLMADSDSTDHVYQIGTQLFPRTK